MNATCEVVGCDKPTRTCKASMCAMHYHRVYRHGSTDKNGNREPPATPAQRYRQLYLPGHPLACKNGKVYEHRKVLFDVIGSGPHLCHWCSDVVDWLPYGSPGYLEVDHLNSDRVDNRPENLVPSCRICNTRRGAQRRADRLRELGYWSEHDTIAGLKSGGRKPRIVDPEAA